MNWCSHLFKNFPQFNVIHTVKDFGTINKAEIDVALELSSFFSDPTNIGSWISGSYPISTSSLHIWKFTVHIQLKPHLENFEHYFTSMWDECNCAVDWAFFGIAFLWDWDENWLFQSLATAEFPKAEGRYLLAPLGLAKLLHVSFDSSCSASAALIFCDVWKELEWMDEWWLG